MVTIRLHNTKTRRKEEFVPLDPGNVRMYVCGPTVYDRAHLGNARPVVVFDVLYRLLRHVYGADHVTYVRNFTDVDDRINQTALHRRAAGAPGTLEELIRARSDETIAWYHADMDALGALRPDHEPRATEWIGAMIAMTQGLIDRGHAYVAEGHVLFAVDSYAGYGALSGRSVDDMIAGARVEVAPYKRNPMDFVLWKPSTDELPGWDSPWGRGRPGWHIECSAMAHELLGDSFDIHAGGIDLQFPHHENEIAQSACAHPEGSFARTWLHNEMLQVEGKKMSKSLGNFFTVRDLLDQGVPGEVIRFVLLSTHYRSPMDWTEKKRQEAEKSLAQWSESTSSISVTTEVSQKFFACLCNDLDTSGAIQAMHNSFKSGRYQQLKNEATLMGIDLSESGMAFNLRTPDELVSELQQVLKRLFAVYQLARKTQEFSVVDTISQSLAAAGITLSFSKDTVSIGEVDLYKARAHVFKNIVGESARMARFGAAFVKIGQFEFRISARAVSYVYVTDRINDLLLQKDSAGS